MNFACSRRMPMRLYHLLCELSGGGSLLFGNRNKTALSAIDLGFAIKTSDEKRKIGLAITPRGKIAIKRQDRGVDPYLVMTEEVAA